MSRKKNTRKAPAQPESAVSESVELSEAELGDTRLFSKGMRRLYTLTAGVMIFVPLFVALTILLPDFRQDSVFDPTMGKNLPAQSESEASP